MARSIFNSHKRKRNNINTRSNKRQKFEEIDEEDEEIDEEFENTYQSELELPEKWTDDVEQGVVKKLGNNKIVKYDERYMKAKQLVNDNMPNLLEILELDNITDLERSELLEKWAILKSLDGNIESHLKYAQYLKKIIKSYNKYPKDIRREHEILKQKLSVFEVNSTDLENKILTRNLTDYQRGVIYSKYLKLKQMSPTDNEYFKLNQWIEYALEIPFNDIKQNEKHINGINQYLADVQKMLDDKIYGMLEVKEEILFILNNRIQNNNSSESNLALVGSAGTGKTMIIRSLAEILDLPFEQISLGGLNDSSYLDGHSYTYEGARPGKIVDALRRMKYKTGIIYFDEIDKIARTKGGLEVSNLLLHIIDFTQNKNFCDKYFPELDIDLSQIWFIFSLNNPEQVDPILLNRMNLIKVPSYDMNDKIKIVQDYLLPITLKNYGMNEEDIKLDQSNIKHIILKSKNDDGIRELKRNIEKIVKKVNIMKSTVLPDGSFGELRLSFNIKFKIPLTLNKDDIDKLLK